ncbi:hypothetical protein TNCV_4785791 [Trichonephila clavipes]|nr:hypothetical protein TNCV_4785791 [Trichonephila clavipes]
MRSSVNSPRSAFLQREYHTHSISVQCENFELNRFNMHRSTLPSVSPVAPGLESVTHWPRVCDHGHYATTGTQNPSDFRDKQLFFIAYIN